MNLATRGLEPVPVNVSAGCAKPKETSKGNKVHVTSRKTNQKKGLQKQTLPRMQGMHSSSSIQDNVGTGACIVLRAVN